MKLSRRGIAFNLALSFTTVSALAVMAALVGWLSYARLDVEMEEISQGRIPAMMLASRLSEQGSTIVASAPNLALAETPEEYDQASASLNEEIDRTKRVLDDFKSHIGPSRQLQVLVDEIAANLTRLEGSVARRLDYAGRLRQWMAELRWLHADYLDEAEPLINDARFAIDLAVNRLSGDPSAAMASRFDLESRKFEAVVSANANAQTAIGLMSRIAMIESYGELTTATAFLNDIVDVIAQHEAVLESWPDTVTLRQIGERLIQLSDPETGIPHFRSNYIEARIEGGNLLEENRELIARLNAAIDDQVAEIQEAAQASVVSARGAMDVGRLSILAAAALSLLVSVLIGWGYIYRSLSRRIVNLASSADVIAAGDFSRQVVREGDDEIAKMAVALERYRRTALEIERANSQTIIDNANVGLLTTDSKGRIEAWNPLAANLLGSGGDLAGVQLGEYASQLEKFEIPQDKPLLLETDCRDREGQMRPLELCILPFRRRDRTGCIVTITDLSERKNTEHLLEQRVAARTSDLRRTNRRLKDEVARHKKTEEELRATQEELVQAAKLAALGQLAAGIGHELNQPLSAIRFYARNGRILVDQGRADDASENFRQIGDMAARMGEISNHLKRFARRPDLQLEPTGVGDAVHRAITLFGPRFEEEGIRIHEPSLDRPVRVVAEDIRLEQVLVNLLSNAADATQKARDKQIRIDVSDEGKWVNIDVSDSGHGVASPEKSRIFDPFFTTKEVGAGLGLGLSISYNIIRDFGGQFELLSSSDEGSTFRVRLLRAEQA